MFNSYNSFFNNESSFEYMLMGPFNATLDGDMELGLHTLCGKR